MAQTITHTSGGIKIQTNLDELQRSLAQFGQTGIRRANMRAINRSLAKGKTIATRLIARKRNLKSKDVRPKVTLWKASETNQRAEIRAKGAMIPLYKTKTAKTQTKLGVKAAAEQGKRRLYKGAFIAMMPNGKIGVFDRVDGTPRLPIRERMLPSVAHTLIQDEIREEVVDAFEKQYEIDIERQLNNEIRKAQARLG